MARDGKGQVHQHGHRAGVSLGADATLPPALRGEAGSRALPGGSIPRWSPPAREPWRGAFPASAAPPRFGPTVRPPPAVCRVPRSSGGDAPVQRFPYQGAHAQFGQIGLRRVRREKRRAIPVNTTVGGQCGVKLRKHFAGIAPAGVVFSQPGERRGLLGDSSKRSVMLWTIRRCR